jgi:hypothetical protein
LLALEVLILESGGSSLKAIAEVKRTNFEEFNGFQSFIVAGRPFNASNRPNRLMNGLSRHKMVLPTFFYISRPFT